MDDQLIEGCLVEWAAHPGAYGILKSRQGRRAEVVWDPGVELSPLVTLDSGNLRRAELPPMVVRVDTAEAGILTETVDGSQPPRWKVMFLTGTRTIAESALRPNRDLDAPTKIRNGELGSYKKLRLALVTRRNRIAHLHDDLVCLGSTRLDVLPHQVGVVHRVVTSYPHRFLLCDEVGLGKTIEAGMVLKELRTRGLAQRTLIVVPPNLVRQWQFELKSKFNETFAILNSRTVRYLGDAERFDGNPFTRYDSVLVSAAWVTDPKWAEMAAEVDWDMVVIDEAHHARSRADGSSTTRLYKLVRELADPEHLGERAALFLTATPMQLDTHELYSLVEMLDPALFPTEEHFERHRREVRGLSTLVEQLSRGWPFADEAADADAQTRTVGRIAGHLDRDDDDVLRLLHGGEEDRLRLCDELSTCHLLSEIMVRNRKSVVGGFMPRRAFRWPVQLTPQEEQALAAVEDYVQHGFARAEGSRETAVGFVMVIFQKLMASSIRALSRSLAKRRDRLTELAARPSISAESLAQMVEEEESADAAVLTAAHLEEAGELANLVTMLDELQIDSKGDEFVRRLDVLFSEEADAKVLVFTEFRETQEYLKARLGAYGVETGRTIGVHLFHGQLEVTKKDSEVESFRNGTGPQVLISTEAGGEGRNFQFCHHLVNYDLPWNPMRVEQRIGRLDRIGQDHVVHVFNLYSEGTIEERVLDVLERRINAFEDTVGGLDPILGEAEADLRKILRQAPDAREEAIERWAEDIGRNVRAARRASSQMADFIMDTKSFRREIAERLADGAGGIGPAEQQAFMTALLADAKTHIQQDGDHFALTFHEPFRGDNQREFFVDGNRRWAVFRPDVRRDSEHVEFFAFGHPIIERIVEDVMHDSHEGVTGSWRIPAGHDLEPRRGWLLAYVVETSGIRPGAEFIPVFVDETGVVDCDYGRALVARGAEFHRSGEANVPPADIPVDSLDRAEELAELHVDAVVAATTATAVAEAEEFAEREKAKLEAWFDHRQHATASKLESAARTLERMKASGDEGRRRIIPVWESNVARAQELLDGLAEERVRRLAEVDRKRHPIVDHRLDVVGWVEVADTTTAAGEDSAHVLSPTDEISRATP